MSYFSEDSQQPQEPQTEDYVSTIVQEKGEQWKDPQVLAKGYANAQEHIAKLETELNAAKAEESKQDYMKEVLEQIKQAQSPSVKELVNENTNGAPKEEDQPQVGVEQINELVKKAITEQESARTAEQNLKTADTELVKQFGAEAQSIVESKRQELGLSKERLAQIAQESPTAFLALVGGAAPQKQVSTTTTSTVNTSTDSFNQSGKRNFAYYNEMRKTNPKLYRSAQIQDQMIKDRTELGADNFYN